MTHKSMLTLATSFLLLGMLPGCSQQSTPSAGPATGAAETAEMPDAAASGEGDLHASGMEGMDGEHVYDGGAHQDHDSKHGGTFFMALDNRHHLEGVLDRPGIFRVYLYDAFTQPVSPEELQQTQAKVIWGDRDGAPTIELKPNADWSCLEALAPEPVRFPVTLTLLARLPGAPPASRQELFTFPFSHYSHIDATPHPAE